MATTPSRPRPSASRIGIPTPVKGGSGIPTPGRSRSSSRAGQPIRAPQPADGDTEQMARALQQAIRNRDPRERESLTPYSAAQSLAAQRPGSVASTSSATSAATPRSSLARPKTPTQTRQSFARPASRQSDVFRSSSRTGTNKAFESGDPVRIESLGYEGILRYIGDIDGKPGTWAGVELGAGFAGLGKNDGSVDGVRYFECSPKGGVFVALNKLSVPSIRRPTSVASHTDGRSTPAHSISGRTTPLYNTPSARPRHSKATLPPPPPIDKFSAGSRASKYANMTADRLRNAANIFNNSPSSRGAPSPTRSELSPSRQGRGSPTRTPKPTGRLGRTSDGLGSPARIDFVTPKPLSRSSTSASQESPRRSAIHIPSGDAISPDEADELRQLVEEQSAKVAALTVEKKEMIKERDAMQEELRSMSTSLDSAERQIEKLGDLADKMSKLEIALAGRDADLQERNKLLEEALQNLKSLESTSTATITSLQGDLQHKGDRIKLVEEQLVEVTDLFASEKKALNSQVDELRVAGQETIALYEDRLSEGEGRRYELEDIVSSLQDKVAALTRPLSPATMARHASEAAQIDNETLREQAAHLQKRINMLEERLEDATASAEVDGEKLQQQVDKHREAEVALKKEVEVWKTRVEEEKRETIKSKDRINELEAALKENATTLEDTRADVETLRAELVVWQNSGESGASQTAVAEPSESARGLQESLSTSQRENAELRDEYQAVSEKAHLLTQISEELQATINDQQSTIDRLREEAKTVTVGSPEKDSRSSRHDLAEKREEIAGLKRIVQQLTQENAALSSQVKIIESERNLLVSETEQLKEEIKVIEDKVEQSLLKEDSLLAYNNSESSRDLSSYPDAESEVAELKRRLTEQEHKHARTVHDYNKEISELESLVESKIYREDELERELERYKEKASRAAKKPRPSRQHTSDNQERSPDDTSTTRSQATPAAICEICEQPGHDIFTCPILQGDKTTKGVSPAPSKTHLWCEDCERPGHVSADCPHSMDVF